MKAKTSMIIAVLILAVIAIAGTFIYKKFNYITDIVLSSEMTVGPEWQSLSLEKSILVSKDVNKLNIDPLPPFEFGPGKHKILAPDGVEFLPEVEIKTDQEIIQLPYGGGRFYKDHNFVSFGDLSTFTKGQTIREIRIRSPHKFQIRTIWWSSYDAKDMP